MYYYRLDQVVVSFVEIFFVYLTFCVINFVLTFVLTFVLLSTFVFFLYFTPYSQS